MFNERKRLIYEMYQKAKESEALGNYAGALKLYYFSMLLMNSLPDEQIEYNSVNFTTDIPEQINRIIAGLRFTLVDDKKLSNKEREITVQMKYNAQNCLKEVSTLDFTFWDGSNQVSVQGRDGLAAFRLFGASAKFDDIKLNIKYAYYEARKEYSVIADLWPVVDKPVFNASKTVNLGAVSQEKVVEQGRRPGNWNMKLEFKQNVPVAEAITRSAVRFLNVVSEGKPATIRSAYQNDPFLRDKILNYVTFNHPEPLSKNIKSEYQ